MLSFVLGLECRGELFCSNECRKCCMEEEIDEVEVELMVLDSGGSSADLHW